MRRSASQIALCWGRLPSLGGRVSLRQLCSVVRSWRARPFDADHGPLRLILAFGRRNRCAAGMAPCENGIGRGETDSRRCGLVVHDRGQSGHRVFTTLPGKIAGLATISGSGYRRPVPCVAHDKLLGLLRNPRPVPHRGCVEGTAAGQPKRKGPRAAGARPHVIIFAF